MFKDFREFLSRLEAQGLLKRVEREVDPVFEMSAGIRKISDTNGPALLFERVKGHPNWQVVGGIFGNRRLLAAALETPEDQLRERFLGFLERRIPPVMVEGGPCQEIVLTGDQIDLTQLPTLVHSEKDAGRYITMGVQIAKNPNTGIRNMSIHRMLVLGKNRLSVWAAPDRHLGRSILDAEALGRGLEIATAIGVDPAVLVGSQAKEPMGVDELEVAGAIHGAPVELAKCRTIDVEVPAHTEIVIEGVTVPGERCADGPFGEYQGCYSGTKEAPVVQVTAITMRRNAFYLAGLTGMPLTENHWLVLNFNEATAYREAKKILPEIVDVIFTAGGTARHHVVISVRKKHEAEPRNLILGLLAIASMGIKRVVVVDDDINIHDPVDVEWAINTRVQPDKDIIIIPNLSNAALDPSFPAPRTTAKWGIDATMPLKDNFDYRKVYIPGQEKVDYV